MKRALTNQEQLDNDKHRALPRRVEIQALDVELPLTASEAEVQDIKEYSFFVVVDGGKDLPSAILDEELIIEVVGVDPIRVEPVTQLIDRVTDQQKPSAMVRRITVRSDNLTRGLTILAWFPERARDWAAGVEARLVELRKRYPQSENLPDHVRAEINRLLISDNPYIDRKEVKVYSGDLRTQIIMESQDTVEHLFGPQFAKYFLVGRVFLRNRRSDKKLVVYTTSLRANTTFYRQPNSEVRSVLLERSFKDRIDRFLSRPDLLSTNRSRIRALLDAAMDKPAQDGFHSEIIALPVTEVDAEINRKVHVELMTLKSLATLSPQIMVTNTSVLSDPEQLQIATNRTERIFSQATTLNDALKNVRSDPTLTTAGVSGFIQEYLDDAADRIFRNDYSEASPLDPRLRIFVSPENRPLAFSENATRQAQLSADGYIWRDYHRPMTFQSVLNSLLVVTDNSKRAQFMRYMEAAGIVAGGLMGFSPVINEFGSRAYVESVAFTTSILLPTARKLLLDDMERYIRNLGDLGMDSVLIVPPNGAIDKYVFFPRGPLFFGIDEFDVKTPSYIVEISKNDVAVQAMLIDRSQELDAGIISAQRIVAEAVDTGRSLTDANQLRLNEVAERARSLRGAMVANQANQLIADGKTNQAIQILRKSEAMYPETQAIVRDLDLRHSLNLHGSPPIISVIPDQTFKENTRQDVALDISSSQIPLTRLAHHVSSTNTKLFPKGSIYLDLTNSPPLITFTPKSNQFGSDAIELVVSSPLGGDTLQRFNVTVLPEYRSPTVSVTNFFTFKSRSSNAIPFTLTYHPAFPPSLQVLWDRGFVESFSVQSNFIHFTTTRILTNIQSAIRLVMTDVQTTITNSISIAWRTNTLPFISEHLGISLRPGETIDLQLNVYDDETPTPELELQYAASTNGLIISDQKLDGAILFTFSDAKKTAVATNFIFTGLVNDGESQVKFGIPVTVSNH